ncbi:hypothetical protein H7347_08035 [Corynebacterium sp. zg-331]|uniref:hypothetical protein n=1 Tax=unclassified Corynebacterium TaxID=2624378 RepID=UPI00128B5808|nr:MULTISPECIES: hypothetical protein [unclassified Corynebacterium]MBC3186517.1 hypothetical protein [Corynebacterium sp. zg-331]MPV53002.1 hypothetical protein [Corynebacterium sp. zg331]
MNRIHHLRGAACAAAAAVGLLTVPSAAQAAPVPTVGRGALATVAEYAVKDSAASVFSCRKNPTLPWCS